MALKNCKKRKRPDRKTCPAYSKEVCFKLQFIRLLTFARRYATIVEPKKAKNGDILCLLKKVLTICFESNIIKMI